MSIARSGARRAGVLALAACALVVGTAGQAAAHVSVNPRTAEQGGFGKFAFRVPTEKPVATTKLEVVLPVDTPVAHVSVRPLAGWKYTVEKAKLPAPVDVEGTQLTEAVAKITWTGGTIGAGEFQEFEVSMGPLPKADRLVFKALQTYANGEVVRWIQEPKEGQPEPENPAPVLKLTPAAAEGHDAAGTNVAAQPASTSTTADGGSGSDGVARLLGGLGLLVGLAGVAVAVLALRRRTP